jgi:hypothetical protein
VSSKTSIYICADSTLTYGPYGGRKKIIKQALPVAVVDSPETAERLIQTVGSKSKPIPANDPDFKEALGKRKIEPGYGPTWRFHYSLPDFERENVETVFEVRKTFDLLVEGKTKEAFKRAHNV